MKRLKQAVQRAVAVSGLARAANHFRAGNPLILMYHGVSAGAPHGLENCEGKHVPLDRFARQLRLLSRRRRVLPLVELINGVRSGEDMRGTAAITFDDGYENNFSRAASVLAEFRMPATFFLSTGYIGTNRWMWTDRLESLLGSTGRAAIRVDGMPHDVPLGSPEEKKLALRYLKSFIKQQAHEVGVGMLQDIERQCPARNGAPEGDHRFMSWDQVRQLAGAGFDVGAHTVNHPILSRVSHADGCREISDSRDRILAEVGRCSPVFCYPNGKISDYTPAIVEFCRGSFDAALSTNRGPARATELHELRRISVSGHTTPADLAWVLLRER